MYTGQIKIIPIDGRLLPGMRVISEGQIASVIDPETIKFHRTGRKTKLTADQRNNLTSIILLYCNHEKAKLELEMLRKTNPPCTQTVDCMEAIPIRYAQWQVVIDLEIYLWNEVDFDIYLMATRYAKPLDNIGFRVAEINFSNFTRQFSYQQVRDTARMAFEFSGRQLMRGYRLSRNEDVNLTSFSDWFNQISDKS